MSFQVAGQPVELTDESLAGHGIYDSDTNERVGTVVREPGGIWRLQSMSDQPLPPRIYLLAKAELDQTEFLRFLQSPLPPDHRFVRASEIKPA